MGVSDTPTACGSNGVGASCTPTCNGHQTRYEVRNRVEERECETCRIIEKRQLERFQHPVGNHCEWGPWQPATDWWTLVEHCKDNNACEPEPTPDPTEEPTPESTPIPTPVPPTRQGIDIFFNGDMLNNSYLLPGPGTIFFVRNTRNVIGDLGESGPYSENTLCSISVVPGQPIDTYENKCRILAYGWRSAFIGVMYRPDANPEQLWFVPAANCGDGWCGFVLPEGENLDSPDTSYEVNFSAMTCVQGCSD